MKIYSALYKQDAHLSKFGDFKVVASPLELTEPGILILHGGEDISPSLYGQTPSSYTYAQEHPSKRDQIEVELFREAVSRGIGIFGICRGAQFLTAMAGGTLIQDVTNHGVDHTIDTPDGERFIVTSAHHQMCNPHGTDHELLAWSTKNRSSHYIGESDIPVYMPIEPEVIYYPKIKALAVQPHPEWMSVDSEFVQYLFKQIEARLM